MIQPPLSRTLPQQLLARSIWSFTRPATSPLLRVTYGCNPTSGLSRRRNDFLALASFLRQSKGYATATAKTPGRPKARKASTPSTRATRKRSTSATKKPKRKANAKAKKPKVKKGLSKTAAAKKERQAKLELRAAALLQGPKRPPQTAFSVLLAEEAKSSRDSKNSATTASGKYKSLSSEEREHYNRLASANKEQYAASYDSWVQSHSPLEIKQANNARRQLNAKAKAAGKKTKYPMIKDDRAVKLPQNAYACFFSERHRSGDFKGVSIGETGKAIGREWKGLSASEAKPFKDRAAEDKVRYINEFRSVYGMDPPQLKRMQS